MALKGIAVTPSGKSLAPPPAPIVLYPVRLNCEEVKTNGAVPSRDSVLPSLPLVCSKKMPYPPRMAILPLPLGSHANPIRGAGLNRCPVIQPALLDAATVDPG